MCCIHVAGTLVDKFASRQQAVWQYHMVERQHVADVRAVHQMAAPFRAARLPVLKAAPLFTHRAQQRLRLKQAIDWAIHMQSSQLLYFQRAHRHSCCCCMH